MGDNIDKNVTPRYMRLDNKVKSLHHYHFYAVQSRISSPVDSHLKELTCLPSTAMVAKSLLPTVADDNAIVGNIKILISRILVETLPFFSTLFSDLIVTSIQHNYHSNMSAKSIIVS